MYRRKNSNGNMHTETVSLRIKEIC
jgi:hypothetical protein